MEVLEYVGYVVLSLLFLYSALNHFANHDLLVGYADEAGFPVPYLAGWPTGTLLVVIGFLVAIGHVLGFIAALGFLTITGLFFHRNLKDPANFKHLALAASILSLIAVV